MATPAPPALAALTPRQVLVWHADRGESHVKPNLEEAARFLEVPAEDVLKAIGGGDLVRGWFVDWEVPRGRRPARK